MIKKKKEEFWNGYRLSLILLVMLFIGLLILYLQSDKFYCSKNPDKCVCENWKYYLDKEKRCSDFRYKSQEELDIDDCNNNPREDDLCKCEEKQTTTFLNITYYDVNVGNVTKEFNLKDICDSGVITDKEVHCKIPIHLTDKGITYVDSIVTAGKFQQFGNEFCIKSRPKTECEKGNIDWVEKTNFLGCDDVPFFDGVYEHLENDEQRNYYKCMDKKCDPIVEGKGTFMGYNECVMECCINSNLTPRTETICREK